LPQVKAASLQEDLYRRDFTINALAINLNQGCFGQVVDLFAGLRDLTQGYIRILHNRSFIDDPTRIFRAVRFARRYNFTIEFHTLTLIEMAVKNRLPVMLSPERIREEIKRLVAEEKPVSAILGVEEINLWPLILPEANLNHRTRGVVARIPEALRMIRTVHQHDLKEWIIYLAVLVNGSTYPLTGVAKRLKLTREERKIFHLLCSRCPDCLARLAVQAPLKMSEIDAVLRGIPAEGYVYILAAAESGQIKERLINYLLQAKPKRLLVNGEDLKRLGYDPGPYFKETLAAAKDAKLDGIINTREEELIFIQHYLRNKGIKSF
jgi:tRNA nucleotidyltransferase (CCA-adding enzyme)